MRFYHSWHLVFGVLALITAFAISALTVNRLVRRRLKLSLLLLGAYVVVHLVLGFELAPDAAVDEQIVSIERLAFAAGLINLAVISFLNPLREDRVPDRYPAILQDFIVIGLLVLVATLVFHDKLLTTSAVSAVVIGFALQDTLGNAFAGLAIQSERPFHQGHWIRVGDFEGRVDRGDLAGDQAADQSRKLRRRSQQHRVEGSHHELFGAQHAGAGSTSKWVRAIWRRPAR